MPRRAAIPEKTQTLVLAKSLRRCCVCFEWDGDLTRKRGQIAHLDGDRSNPAADNLVWLCLPHHDEFDSRTSQSKGLTRGEIRQFRRKLWRAIASGCHIEATETAKIETPPTRYDGLLRRSPKEAVSQAWADVAGAAAGAAQGKVALTSPVESYPAGAFALMLRQFAGVDQHHARCFEQLHLAKEKIEQGAPCPPKAARNYCALATELIAYLGTK